MKYIIGIDLGGTKTSIALITGKRIIKRLKIPTEQKRKKGIEMIVKAINLLISDINKKNILGIGLGVPGLLDRRRKILLTPPNLPDWRRAPLKRMLERKTGLKVLMDNDTNVMTLGEAVFGAGKRCNCVVGLTLGTGVGGGIVINRRIWHGKGNAAELGHVTINWNYPVKSKCHNDGCIEEHISGRGIERQFKKETGKKTNIFKISELAEKGNKKALKVFADTGMFLGIAIVNYINMLDPDIIVIGGGISNAWKLFNKEMFRTIKKRSFLKPCKIVHSKLKDAPVLGAAALFMQK